MPVLRGDGTSQFQPETPRLAYNLAQLGHGNRTGQDTAASHLQPGQRLVGSGQMVLRIAARAGEKGSLMPMA
jgi:hypothetical protein